MSRVDEIRARLESAKGKEVVMDFPLYVDAAVRVAVIHGTSDLYWLLGRVEKLEGLLTRICASLDDGESGLHGSLHIDYDQLCALESLARTLLADESKENEHGNK